MQLKCEMREGDLDQEVAWCPEVGGCLVVGGQLIEQKRVGIVRREERRRGAGKVGRAGWQFPCTFHQNPYLQLHSVHWSGSWQHQAKQQWEPWCSA